MFLFDEISDDIVRFSKFCPSCKAISASPVWVIPERSSSVERQISRAPFLLEKAGVTGTIRTASMKMVPSLVEGSVLISRAGDRFTNLHELMRSMTVLLHAETAVVLTEITDEILALSRSSELHSFISAANCYREELLFLLSVSPDMTEKLCKLLEGHVFYKTAQTAATTAKDCAEYCKQELSEHGLESIASIIEPELKRIFSTAEVCDTAFAEVLAREIIWTAGSASDSRETAVKAVLEKYSEIAARKSSGDKIGF